MSLGPRQVNWRVSWVVALGALLGGAPVTADWLSLSDGGLVETKGPWREKGKTVIYTSTTGQLVSLRLSEVDLAMSRALAKRLQAISYVDLGVNADPTDPLEATTVATDERQAVEAERLRQFVRDPNAQKTSGTLSASSDAAALKNLEAQVEQHPRYASEFCEIFSGSLQSACLVRAELATELYREALERQLEQAAAEAAEEFEPTEENEPQPPPK